MISCPRVNVKAEFDGGAFEPIDTDVVLETPEHVRFRHALAGPSRRILAYVVDTLLRAVVLGLLAILFYAMGTGSPFHGGVATAAMWLVGFALEWGYFVIFETLRNGQTPGKRALHLRVVSSSGRPLGFADSVLRNVLRAADFLPFGYALGFAAMVGDPRFRRLGDRVAGTLVVVEEKRTVDDTISRLDLPSPEELATVPAVVTLLPAEIAAIELYLRRRPRLREARADELAELAIEAISKRLGIRVRYRAPGRLLEILYYRAIGGSVARA
jgi:uncharacterized RDD family membrane protein YckC